MDYSSVRFVYESISEGELYINNKSGRECRVVTKGLSHNPTRGDFSTFNIVVKPTDGESYPNYVYTVEEFIQVFKKVK